MGLTVVALAGPLAAAPAASSPARCTLSDQQAMRAVDTLKGWREVQAFHAAHFPACPDDGWQAEGYSTLVVRLLATRWDDLPALATAMQRDARFQHWVLRHVDASADSSLLTRIAQHALDACPQGHGATCAEVRAAALRALHDVGDAVRPLAAP